MLQNFWSNVLGIATCFILSVLVYNLTLFNFSSFYWGDFCIPLLAFICFAKSRWKLLLWLGFLNAFILLFVLSLILSKQWEMAYILALRINLILLLTLSLFYQRSFFFVVEGLSILLPKKLNLLLFLSAKLIEEMMREVQKIPRTLRVRGVQKITSKILYQSYGFLLAKILIHGLDRAKDIQYTLKARGYHGQKLQQKKDFYALILLGLVGMWWIWRKINVA